MSISNFSSEITIELEDPLEVPIDYVEKHRFLSSHTRQIQVFYHGRNLYTVQVPKGVFNPYKGSAANKLIELILTRQVEASHKQVVDLGCGSGIVGLACIYSGCTSVLFTDINPRISPLRRHPLLRSVDRVKVQDMLTDEPENSYDLIIMSTPTNIVESETWIRPDTVERAIFRSENFLYKTLTEAARCLVKDGELLLWVKISHDGVLPYHQFIMALYRTFDLSTMKIFAHALESEVSVGTQPGKRDYSDLIFSIRK